MSEANFAIMSLQFTHYIVGLVIQTSTNNPCHLWCYYTDKTPLKHPISRTIRGSTVPWSTYFCFVAWQKLEQIEPGDTLIHSFRFPLWEFCQTKWFCFLGTVTGVDSPSASAIFQHHHTGATPQILALPVSAKAYYQVTRSANPGNPDTLYYLAHVQVDADSLHELVIEYGQRVRVIGTYAQALIRRIALFFNTATLPPCIPTSATLRLDIRKISPPVGYTSDWNWSVLIKAGLDLNDSLIHGSLANYSKILNLGSNIGTKLADTLPAPGYQDYWYIDFPIALIKTDGLTALASLNSKDQLGTRPLNNKVEDCLLIADSFSQLEVNYLPAWPY